MEKIRAPAVAGMFYPDNPRELQTQVRDFLAQANTQGPIPKAIIAPHAGYIYSGPVAASVYARLRAVKDRIRRVVLLGPSHRVGFRGIAISSMDAYATPLGTIPIDQQSVERIRDLAQVSFLEQAHTHEHSLEVHLPFLQEILTDFSLVPLVVGDAEPETVGNVLKTLWGGEETLIVISSDLSHYHDYQTARSLDSATSQAIVDLRFEDINYGDACGRNPIRGLLWLARRKDLSGEIIDLRNSGDTAGSKDQVVGYGAYVFH